MTLNAKTILFVDGAGAMVSAVSLGVVLPAIQPWIGMPTYILYPLALVACVFGTYSFSARQFANLSKPIWLRIIIAANLSYCVATLALLGVHASDLTYLGFTYFILELAIVGALVAAEYRVHRNVMANIES
jgi:hypothetical protein